MRTLKKIAVIAAIIGASLGLSTAHANADPSKLCGRVGVYVYPVDSVKTCVPLP